MRTCRKCGEDKLDNEFYLSRRWVCKTCHKAECKANRAQDLPKHNAQIYARRAADKAKAIAHYGGSCSCCSEDWLPFLTLDHLEDNGSEHRKSEGIRAGYSTYAWARRHGYPPIFQVLCYNCNCAKGQCPASHAEKVAVVNIGIQEIN